MSSVATGLPTEFVMGQRFRIAFDSTPEPPVESSEPPPDRPEDRPPLFAVRVDAVLLLWEEEFANVDLTGRKRWTSIELTPEEAKLVRTRVAHMEPEAAALVIVGLLKRKKPGES